MNTTIRYCRICGNENLVSLLNLGEQKLTGIFPKSANEQITSGPLELVKCFPSSTVDNVCGLVQINHVFDNSEMYGLNYGYRSGLNKSMMRHLGDIVNQNLKMVKLESNDLIIDIGSNDGTLLSYYPSEINLLLTGIDPTGIKFKKYYQERITLLPDFFSSEIVKKKYPNKKAKIITSIAMFYDLENPSEFVRHISEILDENGIWVFEQSYLKLMLEANAYDTICHEHAEYYALKQIKWMLGRAGLKIVDVELNDVNGGSFKITAARKTSAIQANESLIQKLLDEENLFGLDTLHPYKKFAADVYEHKNKLKSLIQTINESGKKVFGYGASTKGNVILQFCEFTKKDIPYIAEVNEDKFGSYTPGTNIPIISEEEAQRMKPDYFLVLPWHFRDSIVEREKQFMVHGGKFIFPLPQLVIV
jgi:hypothetical protein